MTQRVRCICGKVYDTAETAQCPSCGASIEKSTEASDTPASGGGVPSPAPRSGTSSLIYMVAHVATLALAVVATAKFVVPDTIVNKPIKIVKEDPNQKKIESDKEDHSGHLRENPFKPDPKPERKPVVVKHQWIVDAKGGADSDGTDPAEVLGKIAENDTITLRPGVYLTRLVFTKPMRFIGDSKDGGHVVIKSPVLNNECALIRTKGVSLENIEFQVDTKGTMAAVNAEGNSGVQLLGCTIQSRSGAGVAGTGNAAIAASKTTFVNVEGSALDLSGQAQAQVTDCTFTNDFSGVMAVDGAKATLRGCKFSDMGLAKGGGSELYARGESASISVQECEFTKCRGSMVCLQKATVTLEDSTLADNGAQDDPNVWTNGLIKACQGGRVKAIGTTFRSNRYGLVAMAAGAIDLQDCHFTGNGAKASSPALEFYTDNVSVTGEGSVATLKHCDFAGAVHDAVNVTQGASATLTDTDISTSGGNGLGVGVGAMPPAEGAASAPVSTTSAHAEINKGHFTGNLCGIVAGGGSSVKINGVTLLRHDTGVLVQDTDTKAEMEGVVVSDCHEEAMECSGGAQATAKNCTFQGNAGGVIVGVSQSVSPKSVMTMDGCTLQNNSVYDATVCAACKLVLQNCVFGADGKGKPKVIKEKGGEIQADPPIESTTVADNDDSKTPSKKQSQGSTKKKSRSSSGNTINGWINRFKKIIPQQ